MWPELLQNYSDGGGGDGEDVIVVKENESGGGDSIVFVKMVVGNSHVWG